MRPSARNNEQGIDADVVAWPRIAERELLGSGRNAAKSVMIEGKAGGVGGRALLHFDESDDAPAPSYQVDLAAAHPRPTRKDPPAA